MLKIKDSVELSELEKFGFIKDNDFEIYEKTLLFEDTHVYFEIFVNVDIKTRDIQLCIDTYDGLITDIPIDFIYDLIQAGLVEKVEQ